MRRDGSVTVRISVLNVVAAAGVLLLGAGAAALGLRFARADVAAGVYRERLTALAADYEALRATYNEAVRRTAVTELIVDDGRLSVQLRNAEGVLQTFETPFNPAGEVYVDYVVVDGRLWIRRVFDLLTPPANALVLDPGLGDIDWDANPEAYGKAVYRALDEGRWVVSVTGDGSLGLVRADAPFELSAPPRVRDFGEISREVDRAVESITLTDALSRILETP
jgi:hypothetical protein